MGKILFSPISKHLKLDFSMSHSDERSLSEEISPYSLFEDADDNGEDANDAEKDAES